MNPEWMGKVDIASAQVAEAVRLFFQERDSTVIHTLVAAAHNILVDLTDSGALKNTTRSPANFMKHADRDPEGRVNVEPLPELNAHYLMDAILLLMSLSIGPSNETRVFWTWYVAEFADMMGDLPEDSQIRQMQAERFDRYSFKELSAMIRLGELSNG